MGKLIWVVLIAAAAWSAWWFVGSAAARRGIETAIEDLRSEGWRIDTAGVRVRGFPNRFDTTIDALDVASPSGGLSWQAPFLQLLALSYRPNRIIAVLPNEQSVQGPFGTAEVQTTQARGSVNLAPSVDLTLERSQFVIEDLAIQLDGFDIDAATLLFATRQPEGRGGGSVQNIGLSVDAVRIPASPGASDDGPGAFADGRLDATLTFDAPLDRHVLQNGMPALQEVSIDTLEASWGEMALTASGTLTVDATGQPSGEISVELANWPEALRTAMGFGWLPEGQAAQIEQALAFFTALSAAPDTLSAPLVFRDGRVFLGPVPLGPAPRF